MAGPAILPDTDTDVQEEQETRTRRQPPYHVILLNDDDHSYQYVIEMLFDLFQHPVEKGFELARLVDTKGKAIVCTTSLERAELKQEQIHAYGPDPLIDRSAGSMTAVLEAAE
jgi:ATP-dependent Clp protease adaptor protein ClpS